MATSVVNPQGAEIAPVVQNPAQPAPAAPVVETPQQPPLSRSMQEREAIYTKFYAPEPVAPAAEPVAPAPVEPIVEASPAPQQPPQQPQVDTVAMAQALNAMYQELQALKAERQPVAAAAPVAPVVEDETAWIEQLKAGDFKGATHTLKESIRKELTQSITPATVQQAIEQTRTTLSVESDIQNFINKVQTDNADLKAFEPLIAAAAEQRLQKSSTQQPPKTPQEYAERYKQIVSAVIAETRSNLQPFRAAGRQEAMVTRTEVLSSSPIAAPVQPERSPGQQPQQVAPPTVESYFAERKAMNDRGKRLINWQPPTQGR